MKFYIFSYLYTSSLQLSLIRYSPSLSKQEKYPLSILYIKTDSAISTFYSSDVNKPVSIQVRIICIEYQQISNIQFDFTHPWMIPSNGRECLMSHCCSTLTCYYWRSTEQHHCYSTQQFSCCVWFVICCSHMNLKILWRTESWIKSFIYLFCIFNYSCLGNQYKIYSMISF